MPPRNCKIASKGTSIVGDPFEAIPDIVWRCWRRVGGRAAIGQTDDRGVEQSRRYLRDFTHLTTGAPEEPVIVQEDYDRRLGFRWRG
ncbi:hypothetical protein Ct61P_01575 [Colletotrichum tofieldiae]|nr:hypothetical protein Ct61P_01575 [Colletotrichum tofieldiae]